MLDVGSSDNVVLDFDVKLADSLISAAPPPAVDLSSISLDLEPPAPAAPVARAPAASAAKAPVENDYEGTIVMAMDVPTQGGEEEGGAAQEVATKLDLARAYEDMGDHEGARELLQEVMAEGSAEQKATAQGMLAKLG
jgi:pilus assembly protein FimV